MATYIHCLETCVNLTFDPGIRIWSIRTRENNNRVVVLPDALFFPGDLAQKFSRSKRLSPSACRRITNRSFLQRETLADFSILRLTDVEHMKCHGNTDNRSKIWSQILVLSLGKSAIVLRKTTYCFPFFSRVPIEEILEDKRQSSRRTNRLCSQKESTSDSKEKGRLRTVLSSSGKDSRHVKTNQCVVRR